MLKLPDNYFKDEIRSGFNVPEMMKRCWAAQMKILDELQALFKKYDLIYYADFGTLLGTIRHGGIIPWDDDVDISMPRADFMKLMEHADEIGGGLTIRSVYSSETFTNFHAVATHKAETLKWDEQRFADYYGCPFICYIDIFPMDYLPADPEKEKLMKQLYTYTYKMVHTCVEVERELNGGALLTGKELWSMDEGIDPTGRLKEFRQQLKDLDGFFARFYNGRIRIDREKNLRNQLCLAAEAIASSCPEKDADRVDYCSHMAFMEKDISRKKEWMEGTKLMPFECTEIAVPAMYHEILSGIFGADYMTPRIAPAAHEYPFYRTQVEVLIGGDTGEVCRENQDKRAFLDALGTFDEVHAVLGNCLDELRRGEGDPEEKAATVQGLLADLQDGAVGIGEAIEELKGEGTATVKKLEEYCEGLYRIYQDVEHSGTDEAEKLLSEIRRSVAKEIHDEIPADWKEKLLRADGSDKKVVIYGISAIEVLAHGVTTAGKISSSADIFKGSSDDICVMLMLPGGFAEFMERCKLDLLGTYSDAVSSFARNEFCICPDEALMDLAISLADAYYGDKCPLMNRCKDAGLPVMIQNYEIT